MNLPLLNETLKVNLSPKMTSNHKISPINTRKSSKTHILSGRRPFSWLESGSKVSISKQLFNGNITCEDEFDYVGSSTQNSTPNSSPLLK